MTNNWMKKATAALTFAMLVTGQTAFAQTIEPETQPILATETVSTVEAEDPYGPYKPTVQEVLIVVCKANGYGKDCAQTLLGMLWNESTNVSTAIGDRGKARGYFQIWTKLHNITVACAEDLVCSAQWTIDYLERNAYPKYVSYAVQCHNSCGAGNGYAAKAARNGARLWDTPLEIKQAAPIDLTALTKPSEPVQIAATF